ncbi:MULTISPECIES: LLM class flavin-dependent oxidoreductase [Gordonia]|uniref:LLM class flavin-dependent oxidoreductase n=1 Tax=Gordonia TaxID=2053 RepID=UPI0007E9338A|nr:MULTISPECIES: LLM class flavin-dependent oxidoreductase [Gordonia]MCM3895191.1 LLM class flavin-dependent oxidoreductase [Gordonia sputi]OBA74881.1 luciferase [Gordonia sp. 852002-10350_SCH5691597]
MTAERTAPLPLSVLDLAPISDGSTPAEAVRRSIALARAAEEWGYRRFWLAEHHFVSVGSSSTATLIALVAAATESIRVGSAAVQLGHHTAASVVEAFGTIDAVFPGRLDLGLGRSGQRRTEALAAAAAAPKGPPPAAEPERLVDGLLLPEPFAGASILSSPLIGATAAALEFEGATQPDFADAVSDILALLDGGLRVGDVELHAVPGEHASVEVWVFGSSKGQSAQVAGAEGLPFVANYHVSPATVLEAVEAYRANFRPSARLSEPYVVVSADVVVAEDDSTATHLASTYGHWVHDIRTGRGAQPYLDPDSAGQLTGEQLAVVDDRIRTQFVGSPSTVAERLDTLARVTGADELVITSVTHDFDDRLRSHQLLAAEWGLTDSRR